MALVYQNIVLCLHRRVFIAAAAVAAAARSRRVCFS